MGMPKPNLYVRHTSYLASGAFKKVAKIFFQHSHLPDGSVSDVKPKPSVKHWTSLYLALKKGNFKIIIPYIKEF